MLRPLHSIPPEKTTRMLMGVVLKNPNSHQLQRSSSTYRFKFIAPTLSTTILFTTKITTVSVISIEALENQIVVDWSSQKLDIHVMGGGAIGTP
uniref:Uncharacterized protein n=1 Tax=Romanomermis culicivorax TaxID=13658 RepID=A0A915K778_ROMCU